MKARIYWRSGSLGLGAAVALGFVVALLLLAGALTGMQPSRVTGPATAKRGPTSGGETRRRRRSIVQLAGILNCVSGCNPLRYRGYGCFCGYRGDGTPVDHIDGCCLQHDWCYSQSPCSKLSIYLLPYDWHCITPGVAHCSYPSSLSPHAHCGQQLCQCDLQFANCVSRFPCPNRRASCRHTKFTRFQNILQGKRKPIVGPSHPHGEDLDVFANGLTSYPPSGPGGHATDYQLFKVRSKTKPKVGGHTHGARPDTRVPPGPRPESEESVRTAVKTERLNRTVSEEQLGVSAEQEDSKEYLSVGNATTDNDGSGPDAYNSSVEGQSEAPEESPGTDLPGSLDVKAETTEETLDSSSNFTESLDTTATAPSEESHDTGKSFTVDRVLQQRASLSQRSWNATSESEYKAEPSSDVQDTSTPLPSQEVLQTRHAPTFRPSSTSNVRSRHSKAVRYRPQPGSESRRSTEVMLHPNFASRSQHSPRLKIEVHLRPKPYPDDYGRPYLRFELQRRPRHQRRRVTRIVQQPTPR